MPVVTLFFLPGTAMLAASALVGGRLPGVQVSSAMLADSPHADAVVGSASGLLPLGGLTGAFPIYVSNVQNLGAATVMVAYDTRLVVPVACLRNQQDFSAGLCNLEYDQSGDGIAETVRFNVGSLDGVSVAADAQLPMVSISWQVTGTAAVGLSTPLSVTVETFDDAQGLPLSVAVQNGTITLIAAPSTTPTATPSATAAPAATVTPTPTVKVTHTTTATPTPTATATHTGTPTTVMDRHSNYLPSIRSP